MPQVACLRSWTSRTMLALTFLGVLLSGCGRSGPFDYVKVSGKVTYEDGTPIPVDSLLVTFYPLDHAVKGKDRVRPGAATVDRTTGAFHSVTSHLPNDGLVPGKYKVTLTTPSLNAISPSIVPVEYSDSDQTPLEVDTANAPFELKVKKER